MKKPGRWQGKMPSAFSCKKAYTSDKLFVKIKVPKHKQITAF
jgi:hypothetical protein